MRKSRYSDSQIMGILKAAEAGTPVPELCREHGMSSALFYRWRAQDGRGNRNSCRVPEALLCQEMQKQSRDSGTMYMFPKQPDKTYLMKINVSRPLAVILILFTLQGCAEIIIVGGATVFISVFDPRPMGTIVTDKTSEFRVGRLLKKSKIIDQTAHINTLVYNHTLLITGEISSKKLKQYISDLVKKVGDIKTVHNYLSVAKPSSEKSRTEDAALTTQIMAQLSSSNIATTEVKVVTERKTVYIMGSMNKAVQDEVVNIAKGMRDVKDVIVAGEATMGTE